MAADASTPPTPSTGARSPWWHALVIVAVVLLGYGIAPTRMPLIGEEPCRALHGIEMAASGDWLVPTQQGVPIVDRPPLQYWTLALVHAFVHPLDPLTVRLVMLVVTLATGLACWAYARPVLGAAGALVAGLAYPTFGHVFDLGRRVETDAFFTLLLGGALLLWHHGYRSRWRPAATWVAGCSVAALATLAKGTQGPVAFFGAVWLYLLWRRDRRMLLSGAHLAGLVAFLGLIAVWAVPFHLREGFEGFRKTWIEPSASRVAADPLALARHIVLFPFEVLGGTLPWSVLALGALHPGFRRARPELRDTALFAALGILAVLLPVWVSQGGRTRYAMALYPLLAVLCGAVVDRALAADAPALLRRGWRAYLAGTAGLLGVGSVLLLAASLLAAPAAGGWRAELVGFAQPVWVAVLFVALSAGVLAVCLRPAPATRHAAALAALVALVFSVPVLDVQARRKDRARQEVAALRERLPPDPRLVSFGAIHEKFVYHWAVHHWAEPIPILPAPARAEDVPAELELFAVDVHAAEVPPLPFEYEELARVDMDPKRKRSYHVLVARRVR